jgi:hypothetical protein
MREQLLPIAAVTIGLTMLLTACGGSEPSGGAPADESSIVAPTEASSATVGSADYARATPSQIAQDVKSAMTSLTSYHAVGTIVEGGRKTSLDLAMSSTGGCVGTVSLDGQAVHVITTGSASYLEAGAAFWRSYGAGQAQTILADRWVTGFPRSQLQSICPYDQVFAETVDGIRAGSVTGTGTVDGVPSVELAIEDAGEHIAIDVAATAPHYLLDARSTDTASSFRLGDFDQPVTAAAPPHALDLKSLGQGSH